MTRGRTSRGFTLIELMIVVGIIGILASIAIPNFGRASMRAKKAERDVVFEGVARGAAQFIVQRGSYPRSPFTGDWNPSTLPGSARRPYEPAAAGWNEIDLVVEGALFHQYKFVGLTPVNGAITLAIYSQGDLDNDGVLAQRTATYTLQDGALFLSSNVFVPADDTAY